MKYKNLSLFSVLLLCAVVFTFLGGCAQRSAEDSHSFTLGDSAFLLDGKPFQIISGEMHYTRIPKEAWRDRMQKAKAMGLNTVSTYVFWNVHEPEKGVFDFSGNNDIAAFVKMAQAEGLWVILRPSPYVCAEWEFGGYPYWLQNEKGLVVRSKEPQYLKEYAAYIKALGKELAPLQINHGGNILMIQVENEYGSYGSDKDYMALNKQLFRDAGFDGLLYTCDPAADIAKGYLPGILPAVNGVVQPSEVKKLVEMYHDGKGPFFIAEWYPAWFDWWGTAHHTVSPEKYAATLDTVLNAGLSINMYMFHGGTTRGFMNGANDKDTTPYEPQISSYDYDAPLDEAGNVTEKYRIFRKVIAKHLPKGEKLPPIPAAKPTMKIVGIHFEKKESILNALPAPVYSDSVLTFEELHQAYGFVIYRTVLKNKHSGTLTLEKLRDYAVVMVNGHRQGQLDRRMDQHQIKIKLSGKSDTLDILVENLGRVNFGPNLLKNNKGITHQVLLDGQPLSNWQMFSLPFKSEKDIIWSKNENKSDGPVIVEGTFDIDSTFDTYLDMSRWGKGVVWVNGHNLGRYWSIGPQQTIYVPGEWLKKGQNKITVFELLHDGSDPIEGIDHPILDKLQ